MSRLPALLACACAGLVLAADKPGAFSVALEPQGMHEECAHLEAGLMIGKRRENKFS